MKVTLGELSGWRPFARSCSGKFQHETEGAAKAAIRSLERRGLHKPELGPMYHYRCRHCGKYHTGHRRPENKPA